MKYTFTIYVGRVWIVVIGYLLFQKQTFNGLLNDISLQKMFNVHQNADNQL